MTRGGFQNFDDILGKICDATERLTRLEERNEINAATLSRMFARIEAVEYAITGKGHTSGLFSSIQTLAVKLENNTFQTRVILTLILTQFVAAIGMGTYILLSGGLP